MRIIGILAYPKIKSRGKRAENCLHNVGKSLEEGLAHEILRQPYVTSNDPGGHT